VPPAAALVVRQDSSRCRAAAEELRACGFDATEALTIEAGLVLLAERPFDLVLCDAEAVSPDRRPLWQCVLAKTVRREAIVALLGPANSHLQMLAACDGSRLAIIPSEAEANLSHRAREILLRRDGLTATLHAAEGLHAPHLAESRTPVQAPVTN
jgi:DNA-binding response OmpR family regulator